MFLTGPENTMGVVPEAPLSGRLTVEFDRPARLVAVTTVGAERWEHTYAGMQSAWEVPILHFLPDTEHQVTVEATDADGIVRRSAPITVRTPALPTSFPSLSLVTRDAARQEPGITLFAVPPVALDTPSHAIALDEQGRVVWYYETLMRLADAIPASDGTILLTDGRTRALEIDMLGQVQHSFRSSLDATSRPDDIVLDVDTLHHDTARLDDGTYRSLSSELHPLEGFPTSPTDDTPRLATANVISDVIVEFDADGTVTRRLPLFPALDTTRLGYDSLGAFWDVTYPDSAPTLDWIHSNALLTDATNGNYVVSMRHQDAVIEFTPGGEVVWILGDPTRWVGTLGDAVLAPVGSNFSYPYAMHAPERTAHGTWLLFDNGVGRAIPPTEQVEASVRTSRAIEYEIDAEAGTAEVVWEYGTERGFELYSSIVGDADMLPETGNVLITFGGILPSDEGVPGAHIVEVTHTTPAEVVFEVTLDDDNPDGAASRIIYRAKHRPSLYLGAD